MPYLEILWGNEHPLTSINQLCYFGVHLKNKVLTQSQHVFIWYRMSDHRIEGACSWRNSWAVLWLMTNSFRNYNTMAMSLHKWNLDPIPFLRASDSEKLDEEYMYIQNNKIVLECIRLLNVDLVKSDPQLPSQTPLPFQEFDPCSWSTGSSDPVIISPTSPCHDTSRSCGEDWPHLWIT